MTVYLHMKLTNWGKCRGNLCKITQTVEEPIFELKMFWLYNPATIVFLLKLAEVNQGYGGKKSQYAAVKFRKKINSNHFSYRNKILGITSNRKCKLIFFFFYDSLLNSCCRILLKRSWVCTTELRVAFKKILQKLFLIF